MYWSGLKKKQWNAKVHDLRAQRNQDLDLFINWIYSVTKLDKLFLHLDYNLGYLSK